MAVTTLSTQIFQYREDTAAPPMTAAVATTVTNTLVGNIAVTGSPTTTVVGNYQIITFTGSGSFTPTATGNVEMMMIAGGGASTWGFKVTPGASSGGLIYYGSNPWEFKSGPALTLTAGTTYTVTIGAGATKQVDSGIVHRPALAAGSNTSISGGSINLIAYGGQGTDYYYTTQANTGYAGAPGAGGSYWSPGYLVSGGLYVYFYTGTNPAPNQGYQGGAGFFNSTYPFTTPGGGGAGAPGGSQGPPNDLTPAFGFGGNGFCTDISGTTAWYGGGGGGGAGTSATGIGGIFNTYGGKGGGGNGGANNGGSGTDGATNTGSGGGGAGYYNSTGGGGSYTYGQSGNGGSGVLILKIPIYNIDPTAINAIQQNTVALGNTATGGDSVTYTGNYRVHTFNSSGTFTAQHTGYIQYLVVAGGGGGASGYRGSVGGAVGGSGGGGGFLEYYQSDNEVGDFKGARMAVTTGDIITVVVGSGGTAGAYGAASTSGPTLSGSGTSSYIYNTNTKQYIYAIGGGGGGAGTNGAGAGPTYGAPWGGAGANQGRPGGSGGGGAYVSPNETSGTDDINIGGGGEAIGLPVQGYAGGGGASFGTSYGGGAGGPGGASVGPGRATTIAGSSVTYAAGGPRNASATATNASPNTGNGGQGGNYQSVGQINPGSQGGSGIVIIRYRFQ